MVTATFWRIKKMDLQNLKDQELLSQIKQLVQNERQVLTKILHHLREVERRKLFSDLGYRSLFEYAIKELHYSEGQAGRRIQAMRLIRELPEVEKKIESGELSLSNISLAQSYFRDLKKAESQRMLDATINTTETLTTEKNTEKLNTENTENTEKKKKLKILESLENKSAREGQKVLLQIQPKKALPKERERLISETHTEVRFVMTQNLRERLEELRSLLGPKGAHMTLAELVDYMTNVSIDHLNAKRFVYRKVSQ